MAKIEKFVIIDGNALMHRAWHALPPTMATKDGQVTNAAYGFTVTLLKVLKDLKPDYLAVTFDLAAPTFRHQEYKEYKATRVKQADELYQQFPIVKKIVKIFNIPIYELTGYEADDVIATLVRQPEVEKIKSIIVTGDLDTLQLVDQNTEVYTMRKGLADTVIYDINKVKEKFDGLLPEQMVDYKALRGDPSDNVPGVKGIGEKGAIDLLTKFKTLENLYQNLDSPKISKRYRELLTQHQADALMSKRLCQMVDQVPIEFKLSDSRVSGYNLNEVLELFQQLEFKSLLNKLPKELQLDSRQGQDHFEFGSQAPKTKNTNQGYHLINTETDFKNFFEQLGKQTRLAVDTETSGLDPFNSELLGISFAWHDGQAYYLPANNRAWVAKIKPLLENPKIKKIGHNIKFDLEALATAGIKLQGLAFDTMVASYLINPGSRQHNLDGLVFGEFGYQMQPITDLIGKGKNQISLKQVDLKKVSDYSCEDADFTWRLFKPLSQELAAKNNLGLLEKIEVPLIPVLADMERQGILLNPKLLKTMSKKVTKDIENLEDQIYKLAKTKFNIASPLQLKEVLFDKLQISTQGLAKTKTGVSTAAAELEKLQGSHKIIDHLIKFRELAKLKSTYLDALPKLIGSDGRIHTSFNQTITATGRLSSSDPNLQNIPVRTELGQKIREAFVAPNGYQLVSADYSQIELRIIASLANDRKMIESFKNNEDIHRRTASEIDNVALDQVTPEMRYAAKAVNFGVIYGQGAWGLASSTGISRQRAMDFIDRYFEIHHEIYDYLENTKRLARANGYVETFFGRRRYLPEINSNIQQVRASAERMAINHPIQGTAADLMKLAMIEIYRQLPEISADSKMLLQVHDELVFEVPSKDLAKVSALVKKTMESIYQLRAPIQTHLKIGQNWGSLK
ncbi:MAG: DNA polymerase I [Patescibacteria group bacterium]|nr:DNA polymerase I [Patescibacteria group bacterium]